MKAPIFIPTRRFSPTSNRCERCHDVGRHSELWEFTLLSGGRTLHSILCRNAKCDYGDILSLSHAGERNAVRRAEFWMKAAGVLGLLLLGSLTALLALLT